MQEIDLWDNVLLSKRGAKRFRTRWKVALVFDKSNGKPIFQTMTHDLSTDGTSVQSDQDCELNTALTLLLKPAPIGGVAQKIIKLQSVVMSSMPFRGGFRLGLRFIDDPEVAKLREVLERLDLSGDTLPSDAESDGLPKLL
jgi:hypothetical protein